VPSDVTPSNGCARVKVTTFFVDDLIFEGWMLIGKRIDLAMQRGKPGQVKKRKAVFGAPSFSLFDNQKTFT
jgi:hypothetical protein